MVGMPAKLSDALISGGGNWLPAKSPVCQDPKRLKTLIQHLSAVSYTMADTTLVLLIMLNANSSI